MTDISELIARLEHSCSPDAHEENMKRWDEARRLLLSGDTGSWPRDIIESIFGGFMEDAEEAASELSRLQSALQAAEAGVHEMTEAANSYAHQAARSEIKAREAEARATSLQSDLSKAMEALAISEAVLRNAPAFETTDGGKIPVHSGSTAASVARQALSEIRGKQEPA